MTVLDNKTLLDLIEEINSLQNDIKTIQAEIFIPWEKKISRETFHPSARNLAAYVGLRRLDLRDLQAKLAPLGLSSLGRCEGHVEATLKAVSLALNAYLGNPINPEDRVRIPEEMEEYKKNLKQNTEDLLGPMPGNRRTRIMVTLPSEAAHDSSIVREWLARGMDCARINMAHDRPADWEAMVRNVRRAETATGRPCRVLMDLGGQKLRIGNLADAPSSLHLKVKRDARGQVLQPAGAILDAGCSIGSRAGRDGQGKRTAPRIPVDINWLRGLRAGDKVNFTDLLGKKRTLDIIEAEGPEAFRVRCETNAYLEPGLELSYKPKGKKKIHRCRIGAIEPKSMKVIVYEGDFLRLTSPDILGEPAVFDEIGELISCAHIPCENPDVFQYLKPGERVSIDDGTIEADILQIGKDNILMRVTRARAEGEKLRKEKGINFPDSKIDLPALSKDDLDNLPLVARLADIVGFSFVQEPEDIDSLINELARHTDRQLPIIAKIETARAVQNLPHLIARGAGMRPFGVMIARGDLAVEIEYERLAEIQEELLWLCEAAHVPVVWATQVLENLVKKGVPTRAEMTDAAMSMRAECVMLNKGAYIAEALALLDGIEDRMHSHQEKKRAKLRALHW